MILPVEGAVACRPAGRPKTKFEKTLENYYIRNYLQDHRTSKNRNWTDFSRFFIWGNTCRTTGRPKGRIERKYMVKVVALILQDHRTSKKKNNKTLCSLKLGENECNQDGIIG